MSGLPGAQPHHKCYKPDCMRKISTGSKYCCGPCGTADEIHESGPLGHTPGCNQRAAERGECTFTEAIELEQR
jgi:hypothetical protein